MKLSKKIAISLFRKKQTKKRKGRYWFNKMTDVEKKRFSDNFENLRTDITLLTWLWKIKFENFTDFLMSAFAFYKSKEKSDYWKEVLNKYKNAK